MTETEFKIKVLPFSTLVFPMAKRMLRNEENARDAVQLSMLKLWENRTKLTDCKNIKAFVFKVVRNTCLDELKRKKLVSYDLDEKTLDRTLIMNNYDEKEAVEIVFKLVDELPKGQKEVLQMRDIDGLDFAEMEEILGMEIPYLRVLLSRARKNIKQKLIHLYAYESTQQKTAKQ